MRVLGLIVLACCALGVGAFTSPSAQDAQAMYQKQLDQAHQQYTRTADAARQRYLQALNRAKIIATRAGDTEEIARIGDAMAEIESSTVAASSLGSMRIYTYKGHRYALIRAKLHWDKAKEVCEQFGGHLVTFSNPTEQRFVASIIGDSVSWIGASDHLSEGSWQWVDGTQGGNIKWASGEPDNNRNNNHYGALNWFGQGLASDTAIDNRRVNSFVCEWDH